jgi:hypothetical protein
VLLFFALCVFFCAFRRFKVLSLNSSEPQLPHVINTCIINSFAKKKQSSVTSAGHRSTTSVQTENGCVPSSRPLQGNWSLSGEPRPRPAPPTMFWTLLAPADVRRARGVQLCVCFSKGAPGVVSCADVWGRRYVVLCGVFVLCCTHGTIPVRPVCFGAVWGSPFALPSRSCKQVVLGETRGCWRSLCTEGWARKRRFEA